MGPFVLALFTQALRIKTMASEPKRSAGPDQIEIDLRNRGVATFLAWLWPGAGHLYQRRYAKGILFMICVLSTYFFGLTIGGGHVVYASWTKTDRRWQYVFQLGVGASALPAVVQNRRVMSGKEPLFDGIMAPPTEQPVRPESEDQLARWHKQLSSLFELGTLYTMVAGLLNMLAMYDAFAGPALPEPDEKKDKPPPEFDDDDEDPEDPASAGGTPSSDGGAE